MIEIATCCGYVVEDCICVCRCEDEHRCPKCSTEQEAYWGALYYAEKDMEHRPPYEWGSPKNEDYIDYILEAA